MKVRWISLFSFSFLFLVSCINREIDQIQIKADIDGLVAGDTILFTRFGLPNWEDLETDTLIVKKEGTFVFTDTATQTRNYFIGNQVSLFDYKGKYLLLYHWGVCPGTIWVHPRLLDLYEKYHDKGFEVLGFTKQEEELPASFRKDKVTASLFNQPWRTVYTTQESNKFIADDYYFAGVPILMLISPEGKTIYRGYTDVYEPLKKLLEENL